jgi:uncharacterized protein YyaL (SSP411 family)
MATQSGRLKGTVMLAVLVLSASGPAGAEAPAGTPPSAAAAGAPKAAAHRLADSGSLYLLQHAGNPVEWYPWGPEALEKARRENKPIFLSVGYSTCYWCHVANRTLYSDPQIAALMNEWFVNVKVDREQRPDLDAVYMLATQLLTGQGGWPNNLFLTPELKPFFAGSYFPPADDEFGRPGFLTVLKAIHEVWTGEPESIRTRAEAVTHALHQAQRAPAARAAAVNPGGWLREGRETLLRAFDAEHGGFRFGEDAAKFPREPLLGMLLADYRRSRDARLLKALTATLDAMAYGGVRDHVGGGFHRYSTDRAWSVPHFEKMLYNNAQLLRLYAEAWRMTRRPLYRQAAGDIADYLARRMSAPEGGFYTAEDAETEGEEGASYLWSAKQIEAALGAADAKRFLDLYGLVFLVNQRGADLLRGDERGVLRLDLPVPGDVEARIAGLAPLRKKLRAVRDTRVQPARDEKMIVALNGLAIEAFAAAGRILNRPDYIARARRAAEHLWALAYDPQARRLKHEVFRGQARTEGFLDDYALLGSGFLALAEASGDRTWRLRAARLADDALRHFSRGDGSLATTLAEKELVIAPQDSGDTAYPSGTSAAVALLLRLGAGEPRFRAAADRILARVAPRVSAEPQAWPALVAAAAAAAPSAATRAAGPVSSAGDPAPDRAAPGAPDTAAHVRVQAKAAFRPTRDEIVITVEIEPGYHVNANPASFDYLIPTAVTFDGFTPARIAYPEATLFKPAFAREGIRVYQGNVEIRAEVPKGTLKRHKALSGTVTAQACNDQVCLPPAKLPLAVKIRGSAGSP